MPTLSLQQTIKLTTAEYFSPQGHAINEVGVNQMFRSRNLAPGQLKARTLVRGRNRRITKVNLGVE